MRSTKSIVNAGDKVIAFDADTWMKTGDIDDNKCFYKEAEVIGIRQTEYLEWLADVRFNEDDRISLGHFQDTLKIIHP